MAQNTDWLDIMSEVMKPPFQMVQAELHSIDHSFGINHLPSEIDRDDEPPFRLREQDETIPIDGFLGQYSPEQQRITIFDQGIEQACAKLGVRNCDIRLIVRIHEWAHALFHLGLSQEQRLEVIRDPNSWETYLSAATSCFKEVDTAVHEHLAQLITLHSLRTLGDQARTEEARAIVARIEDVFHRLAQRQPPEYQVNNCVDVPKSRIIGSILLLKKRWLIGKIEPWKTVITW